MGHIFIYQQSVHCGVRVGVRVGVTVGVRLVVGVVVFVDVTVGVLVFVGVIVGVLVFVGGGKYGPLIVGSRSCNSCGDKIDCSLVK